LLPGHGATDPLHDPVRLVLADLVEPGVAVAALVRVERPAVLPFQVPGERLIKDAIRYTFCYPDDDYTPGVYADCQRLSEAGFEFVDRENSRSQSLRVLLS
jgi:hypothetical protein